MRTSTRGGEHTTLNPKGFALKGGLFPLTLLELLHHDLDELERELTIKSKQAPGFFSQTPAILSVEQLDADVEVDLPTVRKICQRVGLSIVALREAGTAVNAQARQINLPVLPKSRARTAGHRPKEIEFPPVADAAASVATASDGATSTRSGSARKQKKAAGRRSRRRAEADGAAVAQEASAINDGAAAASGDGAGETGARMITTPVRSGQQVYAQGGDLVVTAPVSAGAELLADGSIHVYGPLRGRALAGVKGNQAARIFCQQMDAELVSIAGDFKLEESLGDECRGRPVQVYLKGEALVVEPLAGSARQA